MRLVPVILFLPLAVAKTAFKYNGDMKCGSPVSLTVSDFSCNGATTCDFGSKAEVSGTITLSSDLPSTTCLSAKACFMGIQMNSFCRTYTENNVDLCSSLNMEASSNDVSCPAAGAYSFSADFKIPNMGKDNLGRWWWVTAYSDVTDCSGSTIVSCKNSFDAVTSSNSTASSAAAIVGVAALCAAALYVRKRRVARIDLAAEEERAGGNFEMLRDSISV